MDLNWFNNQDEIIELLKDRSPTSRKTTLSALVSITTHNDKYKQALTEDAKVYQKFVDSQEMSDKQRNNWKDFSQVKSIYDDLYNKMKPLLNSKTPLTDKERMTLQNFIVLSLTCGVWMPPRRSTEWIKFKIRGEINEKEDNYMTKTEFVFNQYKTARFYHEQRVEIPKGLKTILTKWNKKNQYNFLLTDIKGEPITNVRITQILNIVFGCNISTSMLRHIYLSEQLKNVPALSQMKQTAHDMGHSVKEALEYVKH
jgi:hypothetical protein